MTRNDIEQDTLECILSFYEDRYDSMEVDECLNKEKIILHGIQALGYSLPELGRILLSDRSLPQHRNPKKAYLDKECIATMLKSGEENGSGMDEARLNGLHVLGYTLHDLSGFFPCRLRSNK